MTEVFDEENALQEVYRFLRNQDVLTTTEREVTTTTATGTFAAATSLLVAVSNVKNIRSITVASVPLVFGDDYTYDTEYDDSGTLKLLITFTNAQTGAYVVTYDYGSDHIFPDWPLPQLTLSAFPRITVDFLPYESAPGGLGNVNMVNPFFTVVVYAAKKRSVLRALKAIRQAFITHQTGWYYFGKSAAVIPRGRGFMAPVPREQGKDKVFQKNQDFEVRWVYERN